MRNSVKSFGQFIIEAVKTAASTEAKMKGLKGDGHGGWYDAKGKFVAKTFDAGIVAKLKAMMSEKKTTHQRLRRALWT